MGRAVALDKHRVAALLIAALAAATLSTVVQIVLWLAFTDAWPSILFRDARLAAAIVMGSSVVSPPATFDMAVMAIATMVHLVLSLFYTIFVVLLVDQRRMLLAVALGVAFGLGLYAVNMHVFTFIFPWFVQARGWITAIAHMTFGVVAAIAWCYGARPRNG